MRQVKATMQTWFSGKEGSRQQSSFLSQVPSLKSHFEHTVYLARMFSSLLYPSSSSSSREKNQNETVFVKYVLPVVIDLFKDKARDNHEIEKLVHYKS